MFKSRFTSALLLVGLSVALVACESQTFPDAPSARAPERGSAEKAASANEPAQQQAVPGRRAAATGGQSAGGQDLPPDHPPVGAGNGQMGGGQAGANSGVQPPTAGPQGMSPDQFGKVGPLRWDTPDDWRAVKPASSMRLAEYHLPAPQGGEPATLTVFYFGKGGGGAIQDNIDRWVGQFEQLSDRPDQTTRTVNGMTVHLVDASGTFTVGAAMGGGQAQPDWRMRAAIVESPAGNFFFKATGPKAALAAHEDSFDTFVSSFRAAGGDQ